MLVLGGRTPYAFGGNDPILQHYQAHSIGYTSREAEPLQRVTSLASTAEVFYTAQNTPMVSRRNSIDRLRFTKSFPALPTSGHNFEATVNNLSASSSNVSPLEHDTRDPSLTTITTCLSAPSTVHTHSSLESTEDMTPMQRIRSLADFKLYLSPSRLAQVDLISDFEPESTLPRTRAFLPPVIQQKRTLRPAILEAQNGFTFDTIASRRSRPPLRLLGIPSHLTTKDGVRSYSGSLVQHHAEELGKLDKKPSELLLREREKSPKPKSAAVADVRNSPLDSPLPSPAISPRVNSDDRETIAALSRTSNPYYGYPAVRIPDPSHPGHKSIQPQYSRRRKRDLVKTLLFLFLLRIQSWRDQIERTLGLNRLLPWTGTSSRYVKAKDPGEGLIRAAYPGKDKVVKRTWESDWLWMVIGFTLMRGTWTRLLGWPLEMAGLHGARAVLGLT